MTIFRAAPVAIPRVLARVLTRVLTLAPAMLLALSGGNAAAQAPSRAAPTAASVDEAQRHLRAAMAASDSRNWDMAVTEYSASNTAAASIVALDGLANAHFQLRHDLEAYAAYSELVKMTPEIPKGQTALEDTWAKMKATGNERMAEISARRGSASAIVAPAGEARHAEDTPPARKRDRDRDDDREKIRTAENVVFAEVGGNGFLYSINFEHLFGDSDFSVRGGFSYMSLGASGGNGATSESLKVTWLAFPILGNYYVGSENHKLQLGLGATMLYVTTSASSGALFGSVSGLVPVPTAAIGYRYLPARGGFAFFVGLTPFIIPGSDKAFLPWGGLSFGGVF